MATVELNDGIISVDGQPLTSREAVMALDAEVLAQIKTEIFDAIPAKIKEDMIADNEQGARLISEIFNYLGEFDALITRISERYAEYGGPILMQTLASSQSNDKLPSRRYETVSQLGLQYFNNVAGLQKLVLAIKGTEESPAMTAEAITAQNQFKAAVKA